MAANNFEIVGERVDSFQDFIDREGNDSWSNLLYWPDKFPQESKGITVLKHKKFSFISFKDTAINKVRFIGCRFEDCLFAGASVTDCEFTSCTFLRTNTNKLKIKGSLFPPDCFQNNFDYKVDTNIAVDLYHSLYKNSVEEHQPQYATESLYLMKAAENYHLNSQKERGIIDSSEFYRTKVIYGLHDFVSGYGLRVWKVFRTLAIVLFLFTSINYVLRNQIFLNGDVETVVDALYFTAVTITTLGFGDITPVSQVGRVWVVFQALVGLAVISLVLAAVASKALRAR